MVRTRVTASYMRAISGTLSECNDYSNRVTFMRESQRECCTERGGLFTYVYIHSQLALFNSLASVASVVFVRVVRAVCHQLCLQLFDQLQLDVT
jgi:hypothetical protein